MARNGYAWWYVDALSDDGRHGLTIIAFIGSVFSPYYALARRRGPADPFEHCALNVSLYGPTTKKWAMTERGRRAVARDAASLAIGPSAMSWDGEACTIEIDEVTVPFPSRIRGRVRLFPSILTQNTFALDLDAKHRWRPIAPCARVEVALDCPALTWNGSGYCDTNTGDEPLEQAFSSWHWSRANLREGAAILYDVTRRNGRNLALAMLCHPSGRIESLEAPPTARLPRSRWRMSRETHADPGRAAAVTRTLEDGPFYARSLVSTHIFGEEVAAVHESLSLDRFRSPWVQAMLPFRMPRVRGRPRPV